MIGKIPGLDPSQRKLLKSLLDGNAGQGMGAIQESVSEILGDASQVEKARQQMLENPQMAEVSILVFSPFFRHLFTLDNACLCPDARHVPGCSRRQREVCGADCSRIGRVGSNRRRPR